MLLVNAGLAAENATSLTFFVRLLAHGEKDQFNEKETAKRRDQALLRVLSMPTDAAQGVE